jgi:hypothetical protein
MQEPRNLSLGVTLIMLVAMATLSPQLWQGRPIVWSRQRYWPGRKRLVSAAGGALRRISV